MAIEAVSDIRRSGTSAFAGGGGASVSSASVTVTPGRYQTDVVVTDAAATSVSAVLCQLAPNADWDADDLAEFKVFAAPLSGSIIFTISGPGPIVGTFLILYTLG
jgi:urease alpha subunit